MGHLLEVKMVNSFVYDTQLCLMIYWSQRGQWHWGDDRPRSAYDFLFYLGFFSTRKGARQGV